MKFTFCARWAVAATLAWLAGSAAMAAGPNMGSRYQMAGYGDSPSGRMAGGGHSRWGESRTTSDQEQPERTPSMEEPNSTISDDAWGSDDDAPGCGSGWTNGRFGGGLWYGSVDYLLFRPRFSQAIAESRRVLTTNTSTSPQTSTLTDTDVQFPFKYQSSFRVALGYRLLDCGGDIQVAYWRLTNTAQVSDGPANTQSNNPFIAGHLENNPGNGELFSANTGVTANIFDVDFAKCLSFGGPTNPCDCCYCPRWDLRWSAGARIADISRFNNNLVSDANGNAITFGNIDARFVGAGPRVGVQGRRYFGANGQLSVFAKGTQALLIGDYRMSRVKTTPGSGQVPTDVTEQFDTFARMIPVTDIEIGATWQIAPYTFVSAGWFLQCWWDLGQAENIGGTNFGPLDSANILGFDGLFVRGEMLF